MAGPWDAAGMSLVAVIGGGPAGLAAAERLASAGQAVIVYERMPSVGRKFLLAGRGGLNITHSEPLPGFIGRYGLAATALAPAIEAFPPAALRAWCASLGQDAFVGSSGRVFPRAFKSTPLLRAWLARLDDLEVRFQLRHQWTGWSDAGALLFTTPAGAVSIRPAATLLALGGASWPRLGADGAWTETLQAAGVNVAPLRPANCGFARPWSPYFRERFAGAPLKRLAVTFQGAQVRGEAVITADGIEGGAIYALSAAIRGTIARDGAAVLEVDLRPDLSHAALKARLGGPALSTANRLRRAGVVGPAAALLREVGGEAPLADRIKALPLRLDAPRPIDRAISSAGGVAFAALRGLMLEARPGVFVAGEMLDWEAPTGGYLLQASFSTGFKAAEQLLDWLRQPTLT